MTNLNGSWLIGGWPSWTPIYRPQYSSTERQWYLWNGHDALRDDAGEIRYFLTAQAAHVEADHVGEVAGRGDIEHTISHPGPVMGCPLCALRRTSDPAPSDRGGDPSDRLGSGGAVSSQLSYRPEFHGAEPN